MVNPLPNHAIQIRDVRHRYGDREALRGVSFDVTAGEVFALLGPNGSGKTTLFKLLSTLAPVQSGSLAFFGHDVAREPAVVRSLLGVVFQSPALDKKLRVEENLWCHGRLYGLKGSDLRQRINEGLERFGVADRRRDVVETLSGGLQRRVELAMCLMHQPRVLLLDEPSTGLDPGARADLWRALSEAREQGVTVVATTHLLEEAERADRIAILHQGQLAALDTPEALQASVGGDTITVRTTDPQQLANAITAALDVATLTLDGAVRVEANGATGPELATQLYGRFRDQIDELSIGKPTLEDVFIARTGQRFDN
ncbi:Daunorubicin/doxorubicin resistance ATP-binding protein DrrA [Botrimarina colliarenosi]|uniref:Daunorubicin/doxorubicin resistance ATP-binding protein DrrA n=1 Tax=Botrimarina colliarenosi TaxID=2528001 RepID=A0A5C6AJC4_9BACT|nr:Daunorubicin/doxorubicin resistance ATP-binding protein DrrA [Botrimarina colliarenosi]